jgi:DNA repair exonuclease SbcCD ATPase subunit
MEESIQRKDAAIKGLEKETETLQRQLTSVSYDYNELRESLRKESGELDSSRQLRQLENKLASLSNELEHACQKSNNQSLIVKQLNVSLFEREHELAKVRESLAVLEASEKNKEESSQAKALLASVQLIWEELGVSLQSRDSARRMIESCLEDTCNRILEDARALRNDCDRRLKIFSNRLEFVSSALGIDLYEHFGDLSVGKTAPLPPKLNDYKKKLRNYRNVSTSSLQIVTGHSENQTPLLQRLNDYGNILKQLQPRYEAAKERRDRLALDLKNILKSIASLEDMLSINLKKLLNDVREDSTGDGNFYGQMESMYGIPSMERIAEDKNQDEEKDVGTIPDWEKFTCTLDDLEFLENTALHADLANSLSDAFLDECENDLKHLRLKKRDFDQK